MAAILGTFLLHVHTAILHWGCSSRFPRKNRRQVSFPICGLGKSLRTPPVQAVPHIWYPIVERNITGKPTHREGRSQLYSRLQFFEKHRHRGSLLCRAKPIKLPSLGIMVPTSIAIVSPFILAGSWGPAGPGRVGLPRSLRLISAKHFLCRCAVLHAARGGFAPRCSQVPRKLHELFGHSSGVLHKDASSILPVGSVWHLTYERFCLTDISNSGVNLLTRFEIGVVRPPPRHQTIRRRARD